MADETKKVRTVSLVEAVAAFERLAAATEEVIDSQSPVPPGWVRLTPCGFAATLFRADDVRQISPVSGDQSIAEVVTISGGGTLRVAESPAEVAALIAEAQRAQRRAEALPVMAAIMRAVQIPDGDDTSCRWSFADCAAQVSAILDAIERRERGE